MVTHLEEVICKDGKNKFPSVTQEFYKIAVREINPEIGKGVFTEEFIAAKSIIGVDGGIVINSVAHIPPELRYAVLVDENKYLAPVDYSNLENMWYLNHSCDSNIERIGGLLFVAKKDIHPGDQLTIDYSPLIATEKDWKMDCACGARNCRKTISGDDWKNKNIATLLWNEWLPFLQKRIIGENILK